MRRLVGLLAATSALATVVACSSPSDAGGGGGKGGTLTMALAADPGTIDPTLANTFDARVVFTSFCEKLYDADNNLNVVPQLASGLPKVSADGLTVTIPIRTGVKFNDGTKLDANAVKTTLDRDLTLTGSARVRELAAVKSVSVQSPTSVRITLKYRFSPLAAQLADRAGLIMSPAALRKEGKNFGTDPVCVGPFKFKSRTSGSSISFVKSSDYYDADKVKLAGVTYKIITDPTTRAANLQSGDIQAGEMLNATDIGRLKSDKSLQIKAVSAISYEGISINIGNGGVGKPAVAITTPLGKSAVLRHAFELALDRNGMNKAVYDGQESVDCLPLPVQSQFRPANPGCTPYDPAQAKQLVQQSGVSTPIPVTLMIPADSGVDRLAEVIQSEEAKVGFKVTIRPQEFISSLDAARAGKFDTFLIGWSGRLDPDGDLSDLVTTGGSNNFGGISDKSLDTLVRDAASPTGLSARKAIYAQALKRLQQIRSNIYLYHDRWFLGLSSKVHGVVYNTDGIPRFKTATIGS